MRRKPLLMAALFLATWGCGEEDRLAEDAVPLDQVPAPALEAARKELPGVKFENAWKEKADGRDAYEIRGKTAEGKLRDAKVTADGKVLEVD